MMAVKYHLEDMVRTARYVKNPTKILYTFTIAFTIAKTTFSYFYVDKITSRDEYLAPRDTFIGPG